MQQRDKTWTIMILATVIMIVKYDHTVIMIVNCDCKTFILQGIEEFQKIVYSIKTWNAIFKHMLRWVFQKQVFNC
jgi:hypothetical protein